MNKAVVARTADIGRSRRATDTPAELLSCRDRSAQLAAERPMQVLAGCPIGSIQSAQDAVQANKCMMHMLPVSRLTACTCRKHCVKHKQSVQPAGLHSSVLQVSGPVWSQLRTLQRPAQLNIADYFNPKGGPSAALFNKLLHSDCAGVFIKLLHWCIYLALALRFKCLTARTGPDCKHKRPFQGFALNNLDRFGPLLKGFVTEILTVSSQRSFKGSD